MRLSAENARLVDESFATIAELEAGLITIATAQAALESAFSRFENDGSGIADVVRMAEADLEVIQSTTLLDEQLPAAIARLRELRSAVEHAP